MRSRVIVLLAAFMLLAAPALAQYDWDTHWNATGPKPHNCEFNSVLFYPADDVCVRAGVKQTCLPDGSFGPPTPEKSCAGPVLGTGSYASTYGHSETYCEIGRFKFSVGAEICVRPGAKVVCKADGSLGNSQNEATCSAPSYGAEH